MVRKEGEHKDSPSELPTTRHTNSRRLCPLKRSQVTPTQQHCVEVPPPKSRKNATFRDVTKDVCSIVSKNGLYTNQNFQLLTRT